MRSIWDKFPSHRHLQRLQTLREVLGCRPIQLHQEDLEVRVVQPILVHGARLPFRYHLVPLEDQGVQVVPPPHRLREMFRLLDQGLQVLLAIHCFQVVLPDLQVLVGRVVQELKVLQAHQVRHLVLKVLPGREVRVVQLGMVCRVVE